MPPSMKLLVFWILLIGAVALLFFFRHSRIAGVAFTWHGPEPIVGELLSHYY